MSWLLDLLLGIALDPVAAGYFAAAATGHPELGPVLQKICTRESRCKTVGEHRGAHPSWGVWSGAAAMRYLTPRSCVWHRFEEGPWSTSGPWGKMRGYTLPYIGCAPAWVLDVPVIGAFAAAIRMTHPRCRRTLACARWSGLG